MLRKYHISRLFLRTVEAYQRPPRLVGIFRLFNCSILGIKQAFTAYANPKGNADTERLMRTFKEEIVWINKWNNAIEFKDKLDEWVQFYNEQYLHSDLGYMTPNQFEQNARKEKTLWNNLALNMEDKLSQKILLL